MTEDKNIVDLLTKAVGDISAALIMANRDDLISSWTAPYVAIINDTDCVLDGEHQ